MRVSLARAGLAAAVGLAVVASASATASASASAQAARRHAVRSATELATGCFAIGSVANGRLVSSSYSANATSLSHAFAFYLKPTGPGTYMLFDRTAELLGVSDALASGAQAAGGAVTIAGRQVSGANGLLDLGLGSPAGAHEVAAAGSGAAGAGDAVAAAHGGGTVGGTQTPGKLAEWRIAQLGHSDEFTITSTAEHESLAATPALSLKSSPGRSGLFTFVHDSGCAPYPEALVGATGKPFAGTNPDRTVFGFADYHMHLTSNLRAGGRVIYGETFDPFGITVALSAGGDEQEHGPNGTLDVTGNLIRSGSPAGTHDPHGWPTFTGWPVHNTVTHQQIYWVWLERAWMAGLRLTVAQTAEDVELCAIEPLKSHSCDETDSITLQIKTLRAMQDYIDAQNGGRGRGWFRLVYSPQQARRVIERGKLAVVIGVESSNPLGCSEYRGQPRCTKADVDRGIALYHRLGVRSFFITHWVDNAFAGVAIQGGAQGTLLNGLNKIETGQYYSAGPCPLPGEGETMFSAGKYFPGSDWVSRLLNQAQAQAVPTYPPGELCNTKGLSRLGRYVIGKMIAAHMLIDVDHLGERARETVLSIAEAKHYPLISSHTGTGGFWPDQDLKRLYALGGLATARSDTAKNVNDRINSLRPDSSRKFYFGVGLGTDTGGFNSQPPPPPDAARNPVHYPFKSVDGRVRFDRQQTGRRLFDINTDGVAHYGLLADLVDDMRQEPGGHTAVPLLFRSAEAYMEMWQRAAAHR